MKEMSKCNDSSAVWVLSNIIHWEFCRTRHLCSCRLKLTSKIKLAVLIGAAFLVSHKTVASKEVELVDLQSPQILTMALAEGYKVTQKTNDSGTYVVFGTNTPVSLIRNLLEVLVDINDEWNVVFSHHTKKYLQRPDDIIIGISNDDIALPPTTPLDKYELTNLRNSDFLLQELLTSKYRSKAVIGADGKLVNQFNNYALIRQGVIGFENNSEQNWSSENWILDISESTTKIMKLLLNGEESFARYLEKERNLAKTDIEKIALRSQYIFQIISEF